MHKCWMKAAEQRPTFSDLEQLLHSAFLLANKDESDLEVDDGDDVLSRRLSSVDSSEDGSDSGTKH